MHTDANPPIIVVHTHSSRPLDSHHIHSFTWGGQGGAPPPLLLGISLRSTSKETVRGVIDAVTALMIA